MRILDRYILKELMGPFIFGVGAFTSIFIGTGTLFKIAKLITQYNAPIAVGLKLFIYSLPGIIAITFPMSMLLASLLSMGRLSGSSEIIAMKTGGVSFYRLTVPVFAVAFLVSVLTIAFNEKIVPAANIAYNNTIYYEVKKNTRPQPREHIVVKDVRQGNIEQLTYARSFAPDTSTMKAITIQEFSGDKLIRLENAEEAVWDNGQWIMHNVISYDLTEQGTVKRSQRFKEQAMRLVTKPDDIAREQKDKEEMSIGELRQHIRILQSQFVKSAKYEVELQQRFSIPMASFVFALVGTPLGLQPQRSSSSIGLGISIIIIFMYYTVMTLATALGQGGIIPALAAAWIPNILGLAAGAYLLYKASR